VPKIVIIDNVLTKLLQK